MGRVRTKTVKKSSRQVIEKYYSRMTLDFHTNKKILEEVAIIPSKRLRNKIAGFSTHLMKRIQKGPVRGISLKLQEEERERRMDFVPDESAIKTDVIKVDKETLEMLASLGMADTPGFSEVETQAPAPAFGRPPRRMDNGGSVLSLSAPRFPYSSATILRRHSPASSISYSLKPQPPQPPPEPPESPDLRRPEKSLGSSSSSSSPPPKIPLKNPLKGLTNPNRSSTSPLVQSEVASKVSSFGSALASKLRLSSKLSPPPPPPPPPVEVTQFRDDLQTDTKPKETREFRQEGKIFVGNLPTWIKKPEFEEFFRQFGPIETTILIKGHHEVEKNAGFGFIIYAAEKSAMKAVEFDGVEFHGRVLTVKLDDGKRLKTKAEQRARWVEAEGEEEDAKMSSKSSWHQEREGSRKTLQRILDSNGDNWQAVVSAFEKINKPSRTEFGLMVKYYGRRGDVHRARETFERMRARGITPTSRIYTSLIHAYAVGRDMEEALSCVRKMKEEGIEMSLVTYSVIVGGFSKAGNAEAADQWFDEAKKIHKSLNASIYGKIIYAHCQACNMERAEELVREMEEEGIDAPIAIYHTMMDGYTMVADEKKCLIVFKRLKECGFTPTVVGKIPKALEVSRTMKEQGIKHNLKTYSMMINGFVKLKDWANAFAVFEDMVNDGMKPDVILYNNIIAAFCGMGNMERAVQTVKEMQKLRHRPTTRTFMPIIHGYAKSGDMRKSLEVFDMMRRCGCVPTVHTFNALINGLVEKRQIMQGYASVGDTGKAFEYFTRLQNEGLKVDIFTYEALLKACCKSGRMQSALAVTKEMSTRNIPRNSFVYNILIDGWARRGDVWEAADLMQQMKKEGVKPDIHTYTSFISACSKAGDMNRATQTIQEMEALGVRPNIKTYTTLIKGWARASLPEKALSCYEEMKAMGLKPDKAVYHCLMTSLLSRASMAEGYIYSGVMSICKEMVEAGLIVDMGTAVHWSKCLCKIEGSGGELTETLQKTFPPDWSSHHHHSYLDQVSDVDSEDDDVDGESDDDVNLVSGILSSK
ncbi:hypothetical protein HID58_039750 [Brassica napus]|uniref:RRM domain-containing protein n=1 Tax=Brassica napus TaxID=3708 RepID=A0ABQ8BT42_BRANA|nr:hypothetical protein HID58_039750 [Brassica napus]